MGWTGGFGQSSSVGGDRARAETTVRQQLGPRAGLVAAPCAWNHRRQEQAGSHDTNVWALGIAHRNLDGHSSACFHQEPANLMRLQAGMCGPSPRHRVAAPGCGGLHRSLMSRLPGSRHVRHRPSMAAQPIRPGYPKAWFYVAQNGTNRGSERLMKCSNCLPGWSQAGGSDAKTASMLPHCA